jgi:hypothetical protein
MSFRSAYSDFKRGRNSNTPQGNFRDPTPEELKRKMDEYYIQQVKNKS